MDNIIFIQYVLISLTCVEMADDLPRSAGCSYNARKPDECFFTGDENRKLHQIECSKHEVKNVL